MRTYIVLLLLLISYNINAQRSPRERVKAFKIAYITEQLDLTPQEAQKFWPIYNEHEENMEKVNKQEKNLIRDLRQQSTSPDFTDSKAGEYLNDFITVEEKKASLRKQLIVSLKNIIPNKKILTLIKAEADFHKRLVQQLRERRRGN
ncbi:MAG: hypothetical protein CL613_05525 [Aquimarina sp.]|nr:hypothetical protein [Aquimarina sp.]